MKHIDWMLTGTTTPDQSGAESKWNKGMFSQFLKAQNWNLTNQMQLVCFRPHSPVMFGKKLTIA